VPQIDREHQVLIDQVSEFSDAVDRGASRAELNLRVTQLMEGFESHFRSEEALMRAKGYPNLGAHAGEHQRLLEQMGGFRNSLASGGVSLCDALGRFVQLWTEQHVKGPDASFARFLHALSPHEGD